MRWLSKVPKGHGNNVLAKGRFPAGGAGQSFSSRCGGLRPALRLRARVGLNSFSKRPQFVELVNLERLTSPDLSLLISSIVACGISGLCPRPLRPSSKLRQPSAPKRCQSRTVCAETPTASAIREFATPTAADTGAVASAPHGVQR